MSNRTDRKKAGSASRTKSLKTTPDLHAKMKCLASLEARSLTDFVSAVLDVYLRNLGTIESARATKISKQAAEATELAEVDLRTLHVHSDVHDRIKAAAAMMDRKLTHLVAEVLGARWTRHEKAMRRRNL